MTIRKRRRDNSAIIKETVATKRNNVAARSINKKVTDYSAEYMELLTKSQVSQQLVDPFTSVYSVVGSTSSLSPIEPIFPLNKLITIYTESTALRQCVEAYKVNIESYGYVLEYSGPVGKQESKEAKTEKARLNKFLKTLSTDMTLRELREQSRIDMETLGFRAYEISRNQNGEITMMNHVPAHTLRCTPREKDAIEVTMDYYDFETDTVISEKVWRNFRKYIQKTCSTAKQVFFKEFGDPRKIDPETGKEDNKLPIDDQATEIYFESLYVPGNVYGLPRWIGQLPAILGSKEAEFVNLNFFKENAIPALAVMISGGALTQQSFEQITDYIQALKGQKSMNRILILEAHSDESSGSTEHSQPAPKITMQPMISERQQDGLFQDYDLQNSAKVRSAFRLPPIYVGRAEDYTRASAVASMQTAEDQIFIPERISFDEFMNVKILSTYKPKYWKFKSLGVPLSDPDSLSTVLKSIGAEGALTANIVIKIANKILDVDIPNVTEDWGNVPFAIVMQQIKNGATIKGFDKYVEAIDNGVNNTNPADTTNSNDQNQGATSNPAKVELQKIVRNELQNMLDDIKQEVLQTIAR